MRGKAGPGAMSGPCCARLKRLAVALDIEPGELIHAGTEA